MSERALRKTRTGKVISDKMDKTVVVAVETSERHKIYSKIQKRTYKLIINKFLIYNYGLPPVVIVTEL